MFEDFCPNFSKLDQKQLFLRIFSPTQIMKTFIWDDLPKKSLHVILQTLGDIFSNKKRWTARIFREFAQIFRDFANSFTDFAQSLRRFS